MATENYLVLCPHEGLQASFYTKGNMQGREYTSGLQPLGNAFLGFGATAPREYTLVS